MPQERFHTKPTLARESTIHYHTMQRLTQGKMNFTLTAYAQVLKERGVQLV